MHDSSALRIRAQGAGGEFAEIKQLPLAVLVWQLGHAIPLAFASVTFAGPLAAVFVRLRELVSITTAPEQERALQEVDVA